MVALGGLYLGFCQVRNQDLHMFSSVFGADSSISMLAHTKNQLKRTKQSPKTTESEREILSARSVEDQN
jgi:hypothetical protein